MDPLWVSTFIMFVLVIITGYYAWETKKIRLESIRPNFALKTGFFTVVGRAETLYLTNTGGSARNVKIDIKSDEMGFEKLLFAPSMTKDDSVFLGVDPNELKENEGKIEVKLSFEDGYNRKLYDFLKLDFETLLYGEMEEREIALYSHEVEHILTEFAKAVKKK